MNAKEYRRQVDERVAQGYNAMGVAHKLAAGLSNDALVALGQETGHRRLIKTAQRINELSGHEQRMTRSDAETIAASIILAQE